MTRTRLPAALLSAGSLTLTALLAPSLALAQNAAPAQAAPPASTARPAETLPPGVGLRLDVRPIATRKDALTYAGEWLIVSGLKGLAPGKLRTEGNLYVVDLVADGQPKKLQNQLLIRKKDGLVALVFPANLNAPTAEKMVGMEGLEGMSGMTGTRGAVQRKAASHGGNYAINSAKVAQRGIDAWLWINGLPALHSNRPRDLGGIYVADILDDKGARKNQVVVRKADGYVQMINPVKLPMLPAAPGNGEPGKK